MTIVKLDTLSYAYEMDTTKPQLLAVLLTEQESYFKRKGWQGLVFGEGAQVDIQMSSKMGAAQIPAQMKLAKVTSESLELETSFSGGVISQRYQFQTKSTKLKVIYSEQNMFAENRNQYSFILVSLLYKFFYNRRIRERMKYLENLCREEVGI